MYVHVTVRLGLGAVGGGGVVLFPLLPHPLCKREINAAP